MNYDSFSVRFEPSSGDAWRVSVQSPKGHGQGAFQVPRNGLSGHPIGGIGLDRGTEVRDLVRRLSVPTASLLGVGKRLFSALFREEVANLFHASLGSLRTHQDGLRISIAINPRAPESAALQKVPWELMCRPETESFLCLSRFTPVVRSLEAHRELRPAVARPPRLRILVVSANPTGYSSLDLAKEREIIQKVWKGRKRKAKVVFLERGGLEGIRKAFLAERYHILHFMGHGAFDTVQGEGRVLFEGEDGTGEPFEGRHLAELVHDFDSLRLVVLNACHTADVVGRYGPNPFAGVASALVMAGVPAVVAMSGPIADRAAVAFSRAFYQRLAAGDPVEAAVTEGRLAIQRSEPASYAWATPVLFLRGFDGRLFAPHSTVWARRAALIALFTFALTLILFLLQGWMREHRTGEVIRRTNDGIGLLEVGRKEDARKAFRSALDLDPDSPVALGNLAIVEMQLGNDEAALALAEKAAAAAPDEAVHQFNLGSLMALKKRPEEALGYLERAIALDPEYGVAYNELGNVYLELDQPVEARKALEAGLRCDPTSEKLNKNLGRVALAEGHLEEAIGHFKTALALISPGDSGAKAEATYWLAYAEAKTGHVAEACAVLRDFKVLDPQLLSSFANDAMSMAKQHGCSR